MDFPLSEPIALLPAGEIQANVMPSAAAMRRPEEGCLVGAIIHHKSCWWGNHNTFCVILKETSQAVLLAELPTYLLRGDWQNGVEAPLPPDQTAMDALMPVASRR
jgi:hypothetical protein